MLSIRGPTSDGKLMIRSWILDFDLVWLAYWATIAILLIGLLSAAFLVWANRGSQTLTFAAASLGGAIFFFIINVWYQLNTSTDREPITTEFYINRRDSYIGFASETAKTNLLTSFAIDPASKWLIF